MANSIMKEVVKLIDVDAIDDLLKDVGLRRSTGLGSAVATFGLFAAGVAIGAAAGVLMAPKAGQEMREDLMTRVTSFREEFGNKVQSVMNKGERYNPPS